MKNITLGTTYYQNPDNLRSFLAQHYKYADEIILVDDGSVISPITSIDIYDPDKKIKIFAVKQDYGFNSHGCRNLIASKSSYEWIIFLDCDRIIVDPEYAFYKIKTKNLNKKIRYRFTCHVGIQGSQVHGSVNDFLIHKDHFFSAGGYDEELIGIRTGDRTFFKQLISAGGREVILHVDVILTRPPSILISDQNAKSENDKHKIKPDIIKKIQSREKVPDPNKPILTFEWEQINPNS